MPSPTPAPLVSFQDYGFQYREQASPTLYHIDFAEIYKMQPMFDQLPEEVIASAHEKAVGMDDICIMLAEKNLGCGADA